MTSVAPVAPAVVDAAPAAPAPSTPAAHVNPAVATPALPVEIKSQPTKGDVLRTLGNPRPSAPESVPDTVPQPTQQADAVPEIPEAEAAPLDDAPAKEVAPEVTSDGLKFRARNAKGEYVAPDTTTKHEFSIGDKPYSKTVPELVRMATRAVEASRMQNELKDVRERHIPEITQRYESEVQQVRSDYQEQSALNIEIMEALANGDEAKLIAYRDQWIKQNSPETRLQQTQAELDAIRQQTEKQTAAQRAVQLVNELQNTIKPTMDNLVKDHADVFGGEEFLRDAMRGRMERFKVNLSGPPAQRAQQLAQYVQGPLAQWVTEQATQLRGKYAATDAAKQQAETEAQRVRQALKNAEARGLVPVGQSPSGTSPAPRSGPLTKEQALARLAGRA